MEEVTILPCTPGVAYTEPNVPIVVMQEKSTAPALQLRKTATHIQWRYKDATSWENLVALAELVETGPTEVPATILPDYNALISQPTPAVATYFRVQVDENKNLANTLYICWPDGKRQWLAAVDDNN